MKRTLCLFLALILAVGICFSAPVTITASAAEAADIIVTIDTGDSVTLKDADGDGYYDIGTADDLYAFAAAVNGGNTSINGELTANITINENVLTADGELSGDDSNFRVWTPIGKGGNIMYIGTFDGGDNTVSGLYCNDSEYNGVGLFGYVGSAGNVKNVGVIDSYISGNMAVGGVAGSINSGFVINCYNTGTIVGKQYVGGVVGENFANVNECYNTGIVKGGDYVGGVVGYSLTNTSYCYNTGTIKGDNYVGGVVGYNSRGYVGNCYNTSNVTATKACVGGVVGGSSHEVANCYFNNENFTGDAIGDSEGGVANNVEPKTVEQFASGEVAYLLQQSADDETFVRQVWGQKLGEDAFPVFATESNKVYKNQTGGCNEATYTYEYSNIEKASVTTHTPDANGYTVGTDGTHSFKCSGCGTVITEPHNFENDDHQCTCDKRETYSITCTETGSKGGAVRLTNTEPAIHGQTYTTRLLMPEGLQGWYTDVIKVSVNGKELVKGTDYTYDLYNVKLTVDGEKVTGNIEITYQINAAVTFVLNGGDLEPTLKDRLTFGGLYIIDDKITMPLAYGVPSSFNDLNNTFIREGYICTGLKNGEQDADMTAPVVNCTLSVQWQQCTHNTIDENDVCTTCGGNYCGADKNEDKVVWFFDENTATLTITGTGAMATYSPESPAPWSTKKTSIENIVIEKGVTNISPYAFGEYSKLKSITIPDTVTSIGEWCFCRCTSLTSVTIPDSVTTISASAFNGCSGLESVTIGNKVESIGEKAFDRCSALTSVTFGENVESLGNFAFANCTSLTTITLPEKITSISEQCFDGCTSLKSVTISDGVTSIGSAAFSGCTALATVTIGKNVTTIDSYAFSNCTSLGRVTIGDSVQTIGEKAFAGCTNVLLFVDKDNTNVQGYATDNNINYIVDGSGELEKLTFTPIYKEADNENSEITGYSVTARDKTISGALTIPSEFNGKRVTKIGNGAFANCESLTSVVIPDSVVSLGEMAFYSCDSLETVTLSSNITVIPNEAFAYCSTLKTLPITENVTSIGECAFYASGNLGSVSLSNVTIGSRAFLQCGITELTLENCKLNDASVFINNDIKKLALSETDIPDEMFKSHSYLKTLVAEDSVLGSMSFAGCTELENVTVSGGEIKSDAFLECPSLETVTIDNIDSVGGFAFNNCQALKTVEVNATEISEYAFSMCSSLKNVKLGDNVEVIGDAVFEGCDSLAELELPETVTEIGKWVFNGCNLLTELVIPESVTEISDGAFVGCYNLKYIFFEGTEDSQKELGDALVTNAKIHYGSSTHTFNENYTVDTEPTCTEKGSESQHCKYCDLTQNERPVKELGHTPVNGGTEKAHTICDVCKEVLSATHNPTSKVTTAPTCTEEGVETFTCECGYSYTVVVPATGHKEVTVTGKAATCTATGLTDGKKCSVCGVTTVEQQVIPATGHNSNTKVPAVSATCAGTGLTEGAKCSVCGVTTKAQEVVPATGHKPTLVGKKDATTKEAGYTGDKVCSVCNAEIEKGKEIPKIIVSLATPKVAIKNTAKGIEVNWNAIENAESYIVYRSIYNASTKKWSKWAGIKTGVTETSFVDGTVKLGTIYKYTVRAVNGDVKSNYVGSSSLKYNVVPTVKISNTATGVKVSWSTAANATGYRVYRSQYNTKTKKWSGWKNMGTAKANKTAWVDKSVASGTYYKYTVRAVNGKILSSYKASASLMFLSQPTVKFANASTGVKVAWSKVKGATGYTVYRSELVDGKWSKWSNRGTAKANKSSWVDKKVESGVTYKYTVRAINGKVKSSFVETKGLLYLAQPTVTVKAVSNGINVAWSQCEGATGYTVYRSEYNTKTKKWSSWKSRGTAKAEKSNWTDTKTTKGVIYKYTVRSVNADTGAKSSYIASKNVKR